MIPPVSVAFEPKLDAEMLFRASRELELDDPDAAETFDGFAHDFATIRALPETESR